MQGAYKAIDEQINEASKYQNETPGAVDPSTDPAVLDRHKPGVKMVPKYENGKIVNYQYNPTGQDKDGNYTYDMSKPSVDPMDGGNYVRAVEAGEIGISTYGDAAEPRNQLQTERYDIYAKDFSEFKDNTDLSNPQTIKDFTETFQNY